MSDTWKKRLTYFSFFLHLLWRNRAVDLSPPAFSVSCSSSSFAPVRETHLLPFSFYSSSPRYLRPPSGRLPFWCAGEGNSCHLEKYLTAGKVSDTWKNGLLLENSIRKGHTSQNRSNLEIISERTITKGEKIFGIDARSLPTLLVTDMSFWYRTTRMRQRSRTETDKCSAKRQKDEACSGIYQERTDLSSRKFLVSGQNSGVLKMMQLLQWMNKYPLHLK